MPEIDWEQLRAQLITEFDEDIVQQVLLELFEAMTKKRAITVKPLFWCRMRAKSRRIDASEREQLEREGKTMLSGLGLPFDTRTLAERKSDYNRAYYRKRTGSGMMEGRDG